MIDIEELAEEYTSDDKAKKAFIAGAQALSRAWRNQLLDVKPRGSSYDREGRDPEHRRTQCKEAMRRYRTKKKLKEGHQWFSA